MVQDNFVGGWEPKGWIKKYHNLKISQNITMAHP